jgi:hypothetical protein
MFVVAKEDTDRRYRKKDGGVIREVSALMTERLGIIC